MKILITGTPGSGKSSICKWFDEHGYRAVDGDSFGGHYHIFTKQRAPEGISNIKKHVLYPYSWRTENLKAVLDEHDDVIVFGNVSRIGKYFKYFDHVIGLKVDIHTSLQRLTDRPDTHFGKKPYDRFLVRLMYWPTIVRFKINSIPVFETYGDTNSNAVRIEAFVKKLLSDGS